MFKLAKILSSGSNVPEPCRRNTAPGMEFECGAALVMNDGELFNASANQVPTYIAAENKGENDSNTLLCYPITSTMIFEVPLIGDPINVYEGTKVKLYVSNLSASAVSDETENGFITVFSTNGATKSGDRIYVRFI